MKKLLAILLALLMPLCAVAETYGLSIQVDAESDAFLQTVQEGLIAHGADAAAAEKEAALAQQLIDNLGLDIAFQEEAYSMMMRLCGEQLFDLTAYETNSKTLVTSSMLPGYALSNMMEEAEGSGLDEIDWTGAVLSIVPEVDAWLSALEKTESRGFFVGDAYEGGSKCTTWLLEDQDVAALMDAVLNEEVRAALKVLYTTMDLDAGQILSEFEAANATVAKENRYAYLLRVVQDDSDALVGLSVTIMQDGEQAATVSLGNHATGFKVVIGLGLEQQNYWCEVLTDSTQTDEKSTCVVTVREWAASKEDAFAYVQGATAPENTCVFQLDTTPVGGGYCWGGSITANGAVLLTTNGSCDPTDASANGVFALSDEGAQWLSVSFEFAPTDAIPAFDEALVECSATDAEDAELYEKLNTQLIAAISARLLKLLPMEQIMQMNPFTLP